MLLWNSQILLITSVKINWVNSEKYFSADESVEIDWFISKFFYLTNESVKNWLIQT